MRQDRSDLWRTGLTFQSTHLREVRRERPTRCDKDLPVSIHAPARGATINERVGKKLETPFQSTHLREVRPETPKPKATPKKFQSTHLREVRLGYTFRTRIKSTFQSTHLREVRPLRWRRGDRRGCFNPRTCERCDIYINTNLELVAEFQSTHLREVRHRNTLTTDRRVHVSIHAPARGATGRLSRRKSLRRMFQSTHLREVRLSGAYYNEFDEEVSIHAPARGATDSDQPGFGLFDGFNPRTCERCDPRGDRPVTEVLLFQSTHLREVRPAQTMGSTLDRGFNPRTCERCDLISNFKMDLL